MSCFFLLHEIPLDYKRAVVNALLGVVKPGGNFSFHEVLAGKADAPYFPVPWATTAEGSSLVTEIVFKKHLAAAGFSVTGWHDVTADSAEWFEAMFAKAAAGQASKLNLSVLMGDRFPEMAKNVLRNLVEGRIKVVMAVCRRG
ncbi:MAG: hypothetical protein IIC92_11660 [Chloroflexi bacterium]|nr:hypothetical protein [Chloroflexota bacterium]